MTNPAKKLTGKQENFALAIVDGMNQGVFDYITKPFNIPDLSARTDKALASIE